MPLVKLTIPFFCLCRFFLLLGLIILLNDSVDATELRGEAKKPFSFSSTFQTPNWLQLGLEHRTRYETVSHQFRSGYRGSDQQIPLRTRFTFGVDYKQILLKFEGQDSRAFLEDAGSFLNRSHVNEADILQLHVGAQFPSLFNLGLPAKFMVGRQTMDFGKRRLIARNRFRNTTNAFTGLLGSVGSPKHSHFRFFIVQPVVRLVSISAPPLRESHSLDTEAYRTWFWGGWYGTPIEDVGKIELYLFNIHEKDASGQTTRNRELYTPGLRFNKSARKGQFDIEIESVLQ